LAHARRRGHRPALAVEAASVGNARREAVIPVDVSRQEVGSMGANREAGWHAWCCCQRPPCGSLAGGFRAVGLAMGWLRRRAAQQAEPRR
jgi:hypothetical protein